MREPTDPVFLLKPTIAGLPSSAGNGGGSRFVEKTSGRLIPEAAWLRVTVRGSCKARKNRKTNQRKKES